MTTLDQSSFQPDEAIHHYQAQTHAFVEQFLAEHNLTRDLLRRLPEEKARAILKEAHDFAAARIARLEAMIRLGQREEDPTPQKHSHQHHSRLDHHFHHHTR